MVAAGIRSIIQIIRIISLIQVATPEVTLDATAEVGEIAVVVMVAAEAVIEL